MRTHPLLIQTFLATPNTDLNPMPFSPISYFPEETFLAASAMPVIANTLNGVKPTSLYVNTI